MPQHQREVLKWAVFHQLSLRSFSFSLQALVLSPLTLSSWPFSLLSRAVSWLICSSRCRTTYNTWLFCKASSGRSTDIGWGLWKRLSQLDRWAYPSTCGQSCTGSEASLCQCTSHHQQQLWCFPRLTVHHLQKQPLLLQMKLGMKILSSRACCLHCRRVQPYTRTVLDRL